VQEWIDSGQVRNAWQVIIAAIEESESDRDLALIGAGVLESLVASHPDEVIPELTAKVMASPKIARAARSMYIDDLKPEQAGAIRGALDK
jgi:hypothetical protein